MPGASPPISTDASLYTLTKVPGGYDAEAQAIYTNAAGRTVYYRRCVPESNGATFLVRRTARSSTVAELVGGGWACVGGVPTGGGACFREER